ncbi:MAG: TRAP transporter small permease [Pelagibacterium sp.]|uniref:TRAP transporter small permease n=1 Tax=Pelagibacterium sp. TaxID=1967288 RepID=UPI0032EC9602
MAHALEKAIASIANAFLALTCLLIAAMAAHVTLDVFFRYLLRAPLAATLEIGTYYYMIAATFLPFAAVQLHRDHITVDFVVMGMSASWQWRFQILADALGAITAGMVAYYSTIAALEKSVIAEYTVTQYFNLPLWPSRWMPVLGFGLFSLVLLMQLIRTAIRGPIVDRTRSET